MIRRFDDMLIFFPSLQTSDNPEILGNHRFRLHSLNSIRSDGICRFKHRVLKQITQSCFSQDLIQRADKLINNNHLLGLEKPLLHCRHLGNDGFSEIVPAMLLPTFRWQWQ